MTESVSTRRSPSRSNRSSARARRRAVAAAGGTPATAAVRPAGAPAGNAPRDDRTLDLFGDPVLEPDERVSAATGDDASAHAAMDADVPDDAADGRQATLDGFGVPETDRAKAAGDVERAGAPAGDDVQAGADDRQVAAGDMADSVGSDAGPTSDGGVSERADARRSDGVLSTTADTNVRRGPAVKRERISTADDEAAAAAAATATHDEERAPGGAVKARRASSGTRRKGTAGAGRASAPVASDSAAAEAESAQAADSMQAAQSTQADRSAQAVRSTHAAELAQTAETAQTAQTAQTAGAPERSLTLDTSSPLAEPQTTTRSAEPALAANIRDAARPAAASGSAVTQPLTSASFMTKPSADRVRPTASAHAAASPATDPETQLRPLSDGLAALQAETARLTLAADRERRRVNRLLLALAIVVLAALVALTMQTRQIAQLKQEAQTRQQRTDRLAADLSTQQAMLMTLADRHEALLSQVDRLQRNANRDAAIATKRTRRAH
ncbi:flagellar hook-length control protein FliK [Burkholderia dolosa]|nr:flagellar hook-length control protein FliK [Burkholderia dolosa]MBR8058707.1 flagellar hook-length control protein FliK [Burkholderia dolosa]